MSETFSIKFLGKVSTVEGWKLMSETFLFSFAGKFLIGRGPNRHHPAKQATLPKGPALGTQIVSSFKNHNFLIF